MSITTGIDICRKDENGKFIADSNRWMSWKNRSVDLWICEYIFKYRDQLTRVEGDTNSVSRWIIPKTILENFAKDVISRNFEVCPESYDDIVDRFSDKPTREEEILICYGEEAKRLCESIQEDEYFVYYWAGC